MSKRSESARGDARGEPAELPHVTSAPLEALSLADTQRPQKIPGSDPYNSAAIPAPARGHARRPADEMRHLTPGIKAPAAAERAAVTPTGDLALRLAAMREELERVLSDMEAQRGRAVDRADRHAVGLIQRLRESARHLEDAIASLWPPDEP